MRTTTSSSAARSRPVETAPETGRIVANAARSRPVETAPETGRIVASIASLLGVLRRHGVA